MSIANVLGVPHRNLGLPTSGKWNDDIRFCKELTFEKGTLGMSVLSTGYVPVKAGEVDSPFSDLETCNCLPILGVFFLLIAIVVDGLVDLPFFDVVRLVVDNFPTWLGTPWTSLLKIQVDYFSN